MISLAYLILAHAHPKQIGRLVQRLHADHVRFYLHIDANTPNEVYQAIEAAMPAQANVTFIQRRACRWGGFSLVAASLDLLRAAQVDGFDWAILLSGQDYPLKSNSFIADYLANTSAKGFIESKPDFDVRYRYQAWHWERINGKPLGKLVQKIQRGLNACGLRRTLPAPITQVCAGSQWWMLSQEAVAEIFAILDQHPKIEAFFSQTLVPDEMFFQTILHHSPIASQISWQSLRYLEWQAGAWSPRTFEKQDLDLLQQRTELFARKFAADGELTQMLDEHSKS
ncbi:hypothetical protein HQ393_02500 [Chitinibacter bivalviorum]|uniref:Peptide O-xylosyltransferase n=1 Tax=Chitinibacter bivalviorum TaxID=2739434 RepID=A0A7H9BF57_9NEIS|nr:beta-1,6-N-acetylglucosaminyltransferase [Chitinibacter bivalviorum]QLG87207.1 hypothetical protein HQ393_02500 [Chitinibacter bivalviorum]